MPSSRRATCHHSLTHALSCRSSGFLAAQGQPISPAADSAALQALQQACGNMLASLPTSLQQDEQLLPELRCESDTWLAVQWRAGFKRWGRRRP